MWSIETDQTFPLSSVKPFDELAPYRERCVLETRRAVAGGTQRRTVSPVSGRPLEPWAAVEGFEYLRDPESGSLFLADLPSSGEWATLLSSMARLRKPGA